MKKDKNRFSIKFDCSNPIHQEAMAILNISGRKKANLIAETIVFYYKNKHLQDSPNEFNHHVLENIVEEILMRLLESKESTFIEGSPKKIHNTDDKNNTFHPIENDLSTVADIDNTEFSESTSDLSVIQNITGAIQSFRK